MTAPAETVWPTWTASSPTTPSLCAASGCSIFIASSTTTVWPAETRWPSVATILTIVPCIGLTSASPPAPPAAAAAAPGRRAAGPARAASSASTVGPGCHQAGRDGHFQPPTAYLDREPLPRGGLPVAAGRAGRILRRQVRGELGLDPPGMHGERLGGERG